MAYIAESGIAFTHYGVFEQVAHALNRVIVVRNTNPLSTPCIDLGYPPKPRSIKIHTSHQTGKVTCVSADEIQKARAAGFYVINSDGFPRNAAGGALAMRFNLADATGRDQPAQPIHSQQQ